MHCKRRWCVQVASSAEELAEKLTEHTWTLCTGFRLGELVFLNDATSEDGAQEYAVLVPRDQGGYVQVESITFSWCTREQALEFIREVLAGEFDAGSALRPLSPTLDTPEAHGRCALCR